MENTTHESQYANAEISCTADEQLCRDAEFNLLMQAGTIVRMERFNVDELRGVLEQLVADGSCFRTAPASSTMGRVMRHLTQALPVTRRTWLSCVRRRRTLCCSCSPWRRTWRCACVLSVCRVPVWR